MPEVAGTNGIVGVFSCVDQLLTSGVVVACGNQVLVIGAGATGTLVAGGNQLLMTGMPVPVAVDDCDGQLFVAGAAAAVEVVDIGKVFDELEFVVDGLTPGNVGTFVPVLGGNPNLNVLFVVFAAVLPSDDGAVGCGN